MFLFMAAYQSYIVRRIMASRIYRSRALWTGGTALAVSPFGVLIIMGELGVLGLDYSPFSTPQNIQVLSAFLSLSVVDSLLLFGLIDSTIGVARELDFFHTDTLRWKRGRMVAWPIVLAGAIAGGIGSGQLQYALGGALLGVPFAYGGLVLVKSAPLLHDETMRGYLKWLGLIVVGLVAEVITGSIFANLNFPLVFFSYSFYRAAKSLSVRSHLEKVPTDGGTLGQGTNLPAGPGILP